MSAIVAAAADIHTTVRPPQQHARQHVLAEVVRAEREAGGRMLVGRATMSPGAWGATNGPMTAIRMIRTTTVNPIRIRQKENDRTIASVQAGAASRPGEESSGAAASTLCASSVMLTSRSAAAGSRRRSGGRRRC